MSERDATAFLIRAQRSLEAQEFEAARAAIQEGFEREPDDPRVRDLYVQIHLADGIRRNRRARDLRRDEIQALPKGEREAYEDSPRVRGAFQEAVTSLDRVLQADPEHAKAMMLKAGVLDRMDRHGKRAEIRALFEEALRLRPGNEEIRYARDRVLTPCEACHDTGVCPDCQGAGEVSALFLKSSCPTCGGKGICHRCGLF